MGIQVYFKPCYYASKGTFVNFKYLELGRLRANNYLYTCAMFCQIGLNASSWRIIPTITSLSKASML